MWMQEKMARDYDYLLKILLVGDSDVGKHEILSGLDDAVSERPFCSGNSMNSSKFLEFHFTFCCFKFLGFFFVAFYVLIS